MDQDAPRQRGGVAVAELASVQVRLARAAADLDAAELLLRRALDAAQAPTPPSLALRARIMRDCARAAEFCVAVIDTLIAMSGTAAFATSHPIQRAWRDIHFAAMHVALNPEQNFSHFGRAELGLPRIRTCRSFDRGEPRSRCRCYNFALLAQTDHDRVRFDMKFYDCTTAPSPRRVRIFLAEKGISVPTVQVDLRNNEQLTPAFRAINPDATVPVARTRQWHADHRCHRHLHLL